MDKATALQEIFEIDGINSRIQDHNNNSVKKVSIERLIEVMSQASYNLADELNLSSVTVSKFLTRLFPEKPKTTEKPCSYILHKYGYKYCVHCSTVKLLEEFNKNKGKKDGLNPYCKVCHNSTNSNTQAARTSIYRASKIDRTPEWADQDQLKQVYKNCPSGMHVDHIIPLNGELVSGLHVPENLQYLTPEENTSKYNKYIIE